MLYMIHPNHGTTIAYDEQEVKLNEKNGWKVVGPNPPARRDKHGEQVETIAVEPKRGRPRKE